MQQFAVSLQVSQLAYRCRSQPTGVAVVALVQTFNSSVTKLRGAVSGILPQKEGAEQLGSVFAVWLAFSS